jgi:hypothetical protein
LELNEYPIFDEKRIEIVRHAMALNENRWARFLLKANEDTQSIDPSRSIVEAWFVGSHKDIGGGELHDGLSLYPLQWILYEARASGLALGYDPTKQEVIINPLELVLPGQFPPGNISESADDKIALWRFRYANSLEISMYDIRAVHRVVDLQPQRRKLHKRSAPQSPATHNVRLNPGAFDDWKFGERGAFGGHPGKLNGYNLDCKFSKESFTQKLMPRIAKSGAIIHPSVYLLIESYYTRNLASGLKGLQTHLEKFREEAMLRSVASDGSNSSDIYPWIKDFTPTMATPTCRILICGGAGVGKSTLLNRVFGMSLVSTHIITDESN